MSENRANVLVVDGDAIVAESLASFLSGAGYDAAWASSGEMALRMIGDAKGANLPRTVGAAAPAPFAVAIIDMALAGMSGLDLIKTIRRDHSDVVPIAIAGYGTIESAVKAIRCGAIDYLTKPLAEDELRIAVEKAIHQHALLADNLNLREQLDHRYGLANIVGSDARMLKIFEVVSAVAGSKTTLLMCGESGTGKSLIARAVHRQSPRADKPFIEISCGSIPETLLESELFGHVKGAFTGAHADKPGRFLAAHTGTLFLDEINSASPAMQLKLLRVIAERTFEPVGSNKPIEVDVRVILASNQPLEDLVAAGQFRQDLYYRINVVRIQLPPLRDRIGDIPLLADHFREMKAKEAGKQMIGFSEEAMRALRAYHYPGNIRELENIIERAVVLCRSPRIGVEDLPEQVTAGGASSSTASGELVRRGVHSNQLSGGNPPASIPLHKALEEPEKQIILAALEAHNWNRQQTADALQINRTTLYKKIKHYGLEQYGRTG